MSVLGCGCVELTELWLIIECSYCTSELLYRVVPVRDWRFVVPSKWTEQNICFVFLGATIKCWVWESESCCCEGLFYDCLFSVGAFVADQKWQFVHFLDLCNFGLLSHISNWMCVWSAVQIGECNRNAAQVMQSGSSAFQCPVFSNPLVSSDTCLAVLELKLRTSFDYVGDAWFVLWGCWVWHTLMPEICWASRYLRFCSSSVVGTIVLHTCIMASTKATNQFKWQLQFQTQ